MDAADIDPTAHVGDLLRDHDALLVLERVARGAGATRWWSCHSVEDFAAIGEQLRPGSRVGVFFDHPDITVGEFSETLREQISTVAASTGEVLLGTQRPGGTEFEVRLLEGAELAETFAELLPGQHVLFGSQPATAVGPQSFVFTPPDADGEVRPQPV